MKRVFAILRQECRNRHKNLRNRKIYIFCIEAMSKKIRTKKIFFWDRKQKQHFFWFFSKSGKIENFNEKSNIFLVIFFVENFVFHILKILQKQYFVDFVFDLKKIFFGRCRKLRSFDFWGFYGASCTPDGAIANSPKKPTQCHMVILYPLKK